MNNWYYNNSVSTSTSTGTFTNVWFLHPDDDPPAGVREPRNPKPFAPAGAMRIEEPSWR